MKTPPQSSEESYFTQDLEVPFSPVEGFVKNSDLPDMDTFLEKTRNCIRLILESRQDQTLIATKLSLFETILRRVTEKDAIDLFNRYEGNYAAIAREIVLWIDLSET